MDEATHLEAICKFIDDHDIGFDFNALNVLDDEKATPTMIEALKDKLGPTVAARLFCIASSVHFGKTRSGGSSLAEQFQTIGLGSYLQVIPNELTDTEKSLLDKYGQQSK